MKKRIKNTPFWGEVIGNGGTTEKPQIELLMNDGSIGYYYEDQLTDLTIKESFQDFMWSVFAENGSRKNQIKFVAFSVILAFICGVLCF